MDMVKYKNIRIKKRGGGTRTQRVQVLASGKYKFVKNVGRRSNPKKRRSRNPTKRSVRKTARKRRRRRSAQTIPLAPIAGLLAGAAPSIPPLMAGDYGEALNLWIASMTGYYPPNEDWRWWRLQRGLVPLVAGLLVHKFVGGAPLNLNRILARAKVPYIRI